jgi:hypothetical protein
MLQSSNINMAPAALHSRNSVVPYLRSLEGVRDRCAEVFRLAQEGKLEYMEWHEENEKCVVDYCRNIIEVNIVGLSVASALLMNLASTARLWYTVRQGE